jgi:hypothetical protein
MSLKEENLLKPNSQNTQTLDVKHISERVINYCVSIFFSYKASSIKSFSIQCLLEL